MSSPPPPSKKIFIAVIGTGNVGRAFLYQLALLTPRYPSLSLVLISRRSKCLFVSDFAHSLFPTTWPDSFATSSLLQSLATSSQPVLTPQEIIEYLSNAPGKSILVDNTSDQEIADAYPSFLRRGISIVTPNKKAFSGSQALWDDIFPAAASSSSPSTTGFPAATARGLIYHEATVGAGLPILSTLHDLLETGDRVLRISGVFSGTLSFLFNSFCPAPSPFQNPPSNPSPKWSAEVLNAQRLGYTEPDPRDDLNGLDVARKLIILARVLGLRIESPQAFPVQSLIPPDLADVKTAQEFVERLPEFDKDMDALREEAEAEGMLVRFVGSVDVGGDADGENGSRSASGSAKLRVGIEKAPRGSPVAGLRGSDNMVCFWTRRYGDQPLVVQGAGAGADVTAMGVLADLIKVVQRL